MYLKAKQHLKAEQLEQELAEGKKAEVVDDADSGDEDKYADRIDMPGQKFDTKRSVLFLIFENFKVVTPTYALLKLLIFSWYFS